MSVANEIEEPTKEELALLPESLSIEEQLKQAGVPIGFIQSLKSIAYYTSKVGLGLEDACKLADVDLNLFNGILEENPMVRGILERKELQYKKDLLHTLSSKARNGDEKLAQWLLERRFSEFSPKGKNQPESEDFLGAAIEFIQSSGDNQPLISKTSGKAFIIKKTGDSASWKEKLQSMLK